MCVGMTNCFRRFTRGIALCFLLLFHWEAVAQTAFTYTGQLVNNGAPATGTYAFEFSLWDSLSGGNLASAAVLGTPGGVGVTNGLFTVILDFGAGALNGAPRWLELQVRTNGSVDPFTTVTPRQAIPVAPYAVFATTASNVVAGAVGTAALAANAVTADKIAGAAVVKGINNLRDAVTIQAGSNLVVSTVGNTITLSGTTGPAWGLTGNSGTGGTNFLGTADNQPLELRVNNTRGLRLELNGSGQPNVVGGHTNNALAAGLVGVLISGGATNTIGAGSHWSMIGGGRANSILSGSYTAGIGSGNANQIQDNAPYALIGGGFNNRVQTNAQAAMIFGGFANTIGSNAQFAIVTGGRDNTVLADAAFATIAGGRVNSNQSSYATIGGGRQNVIQTNAIFSAIAGGFQNTISNSAQYATIPGGNLNVAAGSYSLAAGRQARANHHGAFVWADSTGTDLVSTANNQFLIRAAGGVGIGTNRPASLLHVQGTVTATNFVGSGAGLTNLSLPAANLTGVLTPAQLPANVLYQGGSGSGVVPAAGLTVVSANPQDASLSNNGYRYFSSIAAPAWLNGGGVQVPSARAGHAAVWTGQELLVWGGDLNSITYLNSGARYRPELDTWELMSPVNAPAARTAHTAVWTGTEMIVWGGLTGGGWLGDGARFAPANQTWNPVARASAPSPRMNHLAVWTGSRMVIWGGSRGADTYGDGALYEPVGNVWTPLTLPNAPAPRAKAGAVWAGDRLLVWGGEGAAGFLNTGGQLLFGNGLPSQWLTNSLTGAPAGRSGHSVVWTGSRLLVWGGVNLAGFLGDGAAYNPATDTWTPIASGNAPTARTAHSAVWTGAEMLVYGGETAGGTVASGGAYDPATDQWRTLANPGSPQPRSSATAVWSGSEAIFFGGLNGVTPLAALQRLTPQPTWYLYRKL